jgi:hypothetical protein
MRITLLLLALISSLSSKANYNDSLYSKQWYINNTGQEILIKDGELTREHKSGSIGLDIKHNQVDFKNLAKNNKDIIVAVVDSGVDINHPDLKGRIWFNKEKCTGLNNEEQKTKACHGWNFIHNNADVSDKLGHGTHVSGIIAANNNDIGIVGISHSNVKIMPIKVISKDLNNFIYNNKVVTDIFADGIRFAIENKANVINLSLGWPELIETPKIKIAIEKAIESGIAVVAAAGNNGKDIPTFPCTYKGVICVGSHDNIGKLSTFSNFGGKIDILAPGEFIVSTQPTEVESRSLRIQGYEYKKGTSQAAPIVSAIMANIYVQNPEISLDDAKSKLYSSTTQDNINSSLFGRVNMAKALSNGDSSLVAPIFKDVLDVKVLEDKSYSLVLTIKNYSDSDIKQNLIAKIDNNLITIKNSNQEINLSAHESKQVLIEGNLKDMSTDSHTHLTIQIGEKSYKTLLVLNRQIKNITPAIEYSLDDTKAENIAFFNNKRKGSLLQNVIDMHDQKDFPEFFYFAKIREQNRNEITMILNNTNKAQKRVITAPKDSTVISIFRRDLNFDGQVDYLVYSKGVESKNIYFWFLDKDLKPLFKDNSVWEMPITLFGGLPESPEIENFQWVKHYSNDLGNILVPVIPKLGEMPEKDNTRDILDRDEVEKERQFYLSPIKTANGITVELRVLDSFKFNEGVREFFELYPDDEVNISLPLKQTLENVKKGELIFSLAIGQEFNKKFYHVTFKNSQMWKIDSIQRSRSNLDQNNIFPNHNMDSQMSLTASSKYLTLYNRMHARIALVDHQGSERSSFEFETSHWSDPIFNYVAGFSDNKTSVDFIESRYNIHAIDHDKNIASLSLYRESSFPTLAFAEVYKKAVVKSDGELHPAIAIDSTLVYGNRIYVMYWNKFNKTLTRPIALSYSIPRECIYLGAKKWNKKQYLAMQCYNGKAKPMSIKLYPLDLD